MVCWLFYLRIAFGPFTRFADALAGFRWLVVDNRPVTAFWPITNFTNFRTGRFWLVTALGPVTDLANFRTGRFWLVAAFWPVTNFSNFRTSWFWLVTTFWPITDFTDFRARLNDKRPFTTPVTFLAREGPAKVFVAAICFTRRHLGLTFGTGLWHCFLDAAIVVFTGLDRFFTSWAAASPPSCRGILEWLATTRTTDRWSGWFFAGFDTPDPALAFATRLDAIAFLLEEAQTCR